MPNIYKIRAKYFFMMLASAHLYDLQETLGHFYFPLENIVQASLSNDALAVSLVGSRASKYWNDETSDLDVMVITDSDESEQVLRKKLEGLFGQKDLTLTFSDSSISFPYVEESRHPDKWRSREVGLKVLSLNSFNAQIDRALETPAYFIQGQAFLRHKVEQSIPIHDPSHVWKKSKNLIMNLNDPFWAEVAKIATIGMVESCEYMRERRKAKNGLHAHWEAQNWLNRLLQAHYATSKVMFMPGYKYLNQDLESSSLKIKEKINHIMSALPCSLEGEYSQDYLSSMFELCEEILSNFVTEHGHHIENKSLNLICRRFQIAEGDISGRFLEASPRWQHQLPEALKYQA